MYIMYKKKWQAFINKVKDDSDFLREGDGMVTEVEEDVEEWEEEEERRVTKREWPWQWTIVWEGDGDLFSRLLAAQGDKRLVSFVKLMKKNKSLKI